MRRGSIRLSRRHFLAGAAAAVALPRTVSAQEKGQIVVANYGGDWSDRTIRHFEAPIVEKAGYKMLRDLDAMDQRRVKLQAIRRIPRGTIDVACMDETDANELNRLGVLEAIDASKISNLADVPGDLKTSYFVPWQFSGWVIGAHTTKVPNPPKSFIELWDPKYRGQVGLTDVHYYHHIEMAALATGQKLDNIDIEKTKKALLDFKKAVQPRIYPSHLQQAQAMKNEEILIGPNYKARLLQFATEGVATKPSYPKEGAIGIIYGFAIPKKGPNPEGAYFYCNAILDPKGMAGLAQESFYSPANTKAPLTPEAKASIEFSEAERKALHIRSLDFWQTNRAELMEWWNKEFKA